MSALLPHGKYAPNLFVRRVLFLSQNTPLGRGKARKLMAALVRRASADLLDVTLFGQNARLCLHNNSSEVKALMNPRRYARAERAFCRRFLSGEDGVFVDIGANAGLFSLGILEQMSVGTLIAAEPQPALFDRLVVNLEGLNPSRPNPPVLHMFQTAVGAYKGELSLYVPKQLGQASARVLPGTASITVPVRPLLDIVQELELTRIDVLKIDIEGFEDNVILPFLISAPKALWPRAIILEHCHRDRWQSDCKQALLEAGYRLEGQDKTNLLFAIGAG